MLLREKFIVLLLIKPLTEKNMLLLLETIILLLQLINIEICVVDKFIISIFASLSLVLIMMQMMENEKI